MFTSFFNFIHLNLVIVNQFISISNLQIYSYHQYQIDMHHDEIFLIMSVPGLDMFRLFLMRLINGKHPFKPDNFHLHHLMGKIFNKFQTFILTFSFIALSIVIYNVLNYNLIFIIFWVLLYISTVLFLINYKKK